jgi:hypothetical protein
LSVEFLTKDGIYWHPRYTYKRMQVEFLKRNTRSFCCTQKFRLTFCYFNNAIYVCISLGYMNISDVTEVVCYWGMFAKL